MGEVRFYHLTEQPLEQTLPVMLERSLARGWRVLLRGTDTGRLEALDRLLWTYRDESFLPHGLAGNGNGSAQPILLTERSDNPNRASALFLIDQAEGALEELGAMEVTAVVFDGHDETALAHARAQWKAIADAGLKAVYWAQNPDGGWEKKTETGD